MKNKKQCNWCGLGSPVKRGECNTGMFDFSVMGGYDSTPGNGEGALDDMDSYQFSLCEFCIDHMFGQFKVAPKVVEEGREVPFQPAEKRVREDEWRKMKEEFFLKFKKRNEARQKKKILH